MENLIGKTFNYLEVMSQAPSMGGRRRWNCKCLLCGNETIVNTSHLKKGDIKSCGCLNGKSKMKDLSGQKFGYLTVIKPTEDRDRNCIIWECECDHGGEGSPSIHYVSSSNLIRGHCLSCGCLKSKGEMKITQLLQDNNIEYIKEYTFDNCIFPDTQKKARFDFAVFNDGKLKYLIEFDGTQHFSYTNTGWDNEETFLKTKKRDEYKNQWCNENNIPLIRIPYFQLKNLSINDLIL